MNEQAKNYCEETPPDSDQGKFPPAVANAFETIKQAMIDDKPGEPGSYAHSWHCNVAMMCVDAIRSDKKALPWEDAHRIGNDAASRFMKLCFDVETKA